MNAVTHPHTSTWCDQHLCVEHDESPAVGYLHRRTVGWIPVKAGRIEVSDLIEVQVSQVDDTYAVEPAQVFVAGYPYELDEVRALTSLLVEALALVDGVGR